jgi:hypothetical protein
MITILVGDRTEYLSHKAKELDITAKLISHKRELNKSGTYYTSLADTNDVNTLIDILDNADQIIYCPPTVWSGDSQYYTEIVCLHFKNKKEIIGLENIMYPTFKDVALKLEDTRKTAQPQFWVAGCSYTSGVGVNPNQRYGHLLGDMFQKQVSFLAHRGADISWAADQILRSDIRSGDTVIWGLTTTNRKTLMLDDRGVTNINPLSYHARRKELKNFFTMDYLNNHHNNLYRYLKSIDQVCNFCTKNNIKVLLVGLLNPPETLHYLKDYKNFINLSNVSGNVDGSRFVDIGTDGLHPGPMQHQQYANEISKVFSSLK